MVEYFLVCKGFHTSVPWENLIQLSQTTVNFYKNMVVVKYLKNKVLNTFITLSHGRIF